MEDIINEMQGAIQEQNQFSTYNRRAQNLNEENQAIINVAREFHMRFLML